MLKISSPNSNSSVRCSKNLPFSVEIFAAHWPMLNDDPIAGLFNRINKYVATNSLTDTVWKNTVLLNQDTIEQVKNLKLTDGIDLQVHGSANLNRSLLRHGLIDQMNIWIYPLIIGKGKRLFGDGTVPANFNLSTM